MTRIAHLSDLHLLDPGHVARPDAARRRLSDLALGRPHDAPRRRRRAALVLAEARRSGADHVIVTGDLTEDGLPAQFEVLAEVLAESRLQPSQVTLVPGDRDAAVSGSAFDRALRGPLAAYAATSTPGAPVYLREAALLPVSTAIEQPFPRSAGAIEGHVIEAAARLAPEARRSGRALLLAMHHAPVPRPPGWQWLDGLSQHAAVGEILAAHDHVHVLHGHTHTAVDRAVRPGATPRIFSTEAVVDGGAPLRFFSVRHGRVWPAARVGHRVPSLAFA